METIYWLLGAICILLCPSFVLAIYFFVKRNGKFSVSIVKVSKLFSSDALMKMLAIVMVVMVLFFTYFIFTANVSGRIRDVERHTIDIILGLITFCVAMNALVPYFIAQISIKNEVNRRFEQELEKAQIDYKNAIVKLQMAEAHLSRMTSYFLLKDIQLQTLDETLSSAMDKKQDSYWALGWASKALKRYLSCMNGDIQQMPDSDICKSTVQYMVIASKAIQQDIEQDEKQDAYNDDDGKKMRTFVYLFDSIMFYDKKSGYTLEVLDKYFGEMRNVLQQLYIYLTKVVRYNRQGKDSLLYEVYVKSRCEDYLNVADNTDRFTAFKACFESCFNR